MTEQPEIDAKSMHEETVTSYARSLAVDTDKLYAGAIRAYLGVELVGEGTPRDLALRYKDRMQLLVYGASGPHKVTTLAFDGEPIVAVTDPVFNQHTDPETGAFYMTATRKIWKWKQ